MNIYKEETFYSIRIVYIYIYRYIRLSEMPYYIMKKARSAQADLGAAWHI